MRGPAGWEWLTDRTRGLGGWIMAVGTLARRHWLFTIVFGTGLVLRILTQIAYSPALVYIDTDRYLHGDSSLDPLGYLALLWPLQRAGGLAVVAAVQHLLGLGMAVALYCVLVRRGMWRWAAALAATPLLLDGYQLQAEQTIMPDVLFEALIMAALALLLWRRRPAAWQAGLAGLAVGVSADVRQVGAVLVVPVLAFLLIRLTRWPRVTGSALFAVCSVIPVLLYMVVQLAVTGQFSFTQRNSYVFYGRTAAAANCATLKLPADERSLCPSPQVVATLGIDGLVGDPDGPLLSYQPPPGRSIQAMADRFERAVVEQQPMAVVGAIHRDFVKLFALTRNTAPGDMPVSRWQFQTSYPTYPPLITLPYVASITPGGAQPTVIRPLAELLRGYQLHGGYTPGPLLAVAALLGLAGSCMAGFRRPGYTATATACLLATGMAIILLLGSDAYEFSWRYQLPALILLPPAGILGAAAVTAALRDALPKRAGVRGSSHLPARQDGEPDLVSARSELAELQVAEPARLLLGHGHGDRVLAEVGDGIAEVLEQQGGHVPADAQADQDALYGDVRGAAGKGVGGHLPPLVAQPVGQIEQRVAGVLAVADPPGYGRDPGVGVAVAQQLERPQLDDLRGQVLADVIGRLMDPAVAVLAEPEEVVVTGDDLAGRPGEVDLEDRHVAAEVVHVEDQLIRELGGIPPDDPARAEWGQPELVPRRADRLDPW